jgi:hypothetical protein
LASAFRRGVVDMRVSTDDPDLASQRTRLESAGAFRVFADVISIDLASPICSTTSAPATRSPSSASTDSDVWF